MSTRVVHVRDEVEGAIYIGRWNSFYNLKRSKWHNPFKIGRDTQVRGEAVLMYMSYLYKGDGHHLLKDLPELRDKPLACWCRHDGETEPRCHGDVLVDLLDTYTDEELRSM